MSLTHDTTIMGADWVRALGVSRARIAGAAGRRALALAACTNSSCSIRYGCGRYGRESIVRSAWIGGEGCAGFTPPLVNQSLLPVAA